LKFVGETESERLMRREWVFGLGVVGVKTVESVEFLEELFMGV
jgi:hypothetical protein